MRGMVSVICRYFARLCSNGRPYEGAGCTIYGTGGFTLAELMVVVAIIGVMSTIAIPSYLKMQPHMRLKAAARDVASAMQHGRMTAISKNSTQNITFDITGDSFAYGNINSNEWKDIDIYDPALAAYTGGVGKLTGNKITFRPDGTTSMTAVSEAVYLRNKKQPGGGWEFYRVQVLNNGIVKVQKYVGGGSGWQRG